MPDEDVPPSVPVRALQRAGHRRRAGPTRAQLTPVQQVLCDAARLRIVQALGEDALSVGTLAEVIGRQVPATAQHLRVLRELGIVERERRGTTIHYRLADGPLATTVQAVLQIIAGRPAASA